MEQMLAMSEKFFGLAADKKTNYKFDLVRFKLRTLRAWISQSTAARLLSDC